MTPTEILAATIFAEDRGGKASGMEPIAGVILNRSETPGWWGNDIVGVCLCPGQFSGWFWRDPNFRVMLTADKSNPAYVLGYEIAERAVSGQEVNRAGGATHYFAKTLMDRPPPWYFHNSALRTNARTPCFETPHHLFFKIGLQE